MSRGRQIVRLKLRPLSPHAKSILLDWEPGKLYSYPERFPRLTSAELFGNSNPLEVEIGPGSGEFLCFLAASQPDRNFLGIEVSHRSASACAALAAEQGLLNVRILRTDFKLLAPLQPSSGWFRVYLHFPDPPHKTADEKRRIFTKAFLDLMQRTLAPNGDISVASDKPDFFFKMLGLAERDSRFKLAHQKRYLHGFDAPVKSRFQRFWERKGIQPLRFILLKLPDP
jgi:tRNA (guanine-N7-)-methyltransferase